MIELCNDLREHVDDILVEWQEIALEEPWLSLPYSDRVDQLPRVVSELLDAALCAPGEDSTTRKQIMAAAAHGEDRRANGLSQDLLFREYYLLREAIWRYIQRECSTEREGVQAILLVDATLALSTRASLYGYHREELEAMDRWPSALLAIANVAPALDER